jgi:hypothetical protein
MSVAVADLLALGLVLAIEKWSVLRVHLVCLSAYNALQVGALRLPSGVDVSTQRNISGVPEPQQDLDSHIASFARQGFTKEDMIGLVACGCVPHKEPPPALSHRFQTHFWWRSARSIPRYCAGIE